jgi:hypothetical protein
MGGGGQPGKGGKGGGPPGKGRLFQLPARAEGYQHEWNQIRECESERPIAPVTVLPLDTFLEQYRRHVGPPVSSSRPYCESCRRLEIREKWLKKQACSVCGESLSELPPAYQP